MERARKQGSDYGSGSRISVQIQKIIDSQELVALRYALLMGEKITHSLSPTWAVIIIRWHFHFLSVHVSFSLFHYEMNYVVNYVRKEMGCVRDWQGTDKCATGEEGLEMGGDGSSDLCEPGATRRQ